MSENSASGEPGDWAIEAPIPHAMLRISPWIPLFVWCTGLLFGAVSFWSTECFIIEVLAFVFGASGLLVLFARRFANDRLRSNWRQSLVIALIAMASLLAAPALRHHLFNLTKTDGTTIARAVLLYEQRHGTPPARLSDLLNAELLAIPKPWLLGSDWSYARGGSGRFELWFWIADRRGFRVGADLRWQLVDGS